MMCQLFLFSIGRREISWRVMSISHFPFFLFQIDSDNYWRSTVFQSFIFSSFHPSPSPLPYISDSSPLVVLKRSFFICLTSSGLAPLWPNLAMFGHVSRSIFHTLCSLARESWLDSPPAFSSAGCLPHLGYKSGRSTSWSIRARVWAHGMGHKIASSIPASTFIAKDREFYKRCLWS